MNKRFPFTCALPYMKKKTEFVKTTPRNSETQNFPKFIIKGKYIIGFI